MNYKINAYKPSGEDDHQQYLTSCNADDRDATFFRINYVVHGCGFVSDIEVTDSRLAYEIIRAMESAREDGRNSAFKDIRNLIGVK